MFSALFIISLAACFANFAQGSLEYLIVTYRIPSHWPSDTVEGLQVYGIPNSNNELTQSGQKAAYNLGKELAKKYGKELNAAKSDKLYNEEFWSFSTKSTPSREAALYLGKGLQNIGQPGPHQWSEQQLKDVILEKTENFTSTLDPKRCPGFFEDITNLPQFTDFIKKYKKTLEIVNKKYKMPENKPYLIWVAYETLMKMKATKHKISPEIEKVLNELYTISRQILYSAGSSDDLKKLFGGRLFSDILQDLENKMEGKAINIPERYGKNGNKIKASFFAAPQGVVASQLAVFNPKGTTYGGNVLTPETFYPQQGAVHLIELHKEDGKWKVKVQYRRTDILFTAFLTAKFPGCDSELCEYETFKKSVNQFKLSDEERNKICKAPKKN